MGDIKVNAHRRGKSFVKSYLRMTQNTGVRRRTHDFIQAKYAAGVALLGGSRHTRQYGNTRLGKKLYKRHFYNGPMNRLTDISTGRPRRKG